MAESIKSTTKTTEPNRTEPKTTLMHSVFSVWHHTWKRWTKCHLQRERENNTTSTTTKNKLLYHAVSHFNRCVKPKTMNSCLSTPFNVQGVENEWKDHLFYLIWIQSMDNLNFFLSSPIYLSLSLSLTRKIGIQSYAKPYILTWKKPA